jgi:hypothetical protein
MKLQTVIVLSAIQAVDYGSLPADHGVKTAARRAATTFLPFDFRLSGPPGAGRARGIISPSG